MGLSQRLDDHARTTPTRMAFADKTSGEWRTTSWRAYRDGTVAVARSLHALGVRAGDVVTVLGANRPEWNITILASMRLGAWSAGIYTTSSPEEVRYILTHSESPVLVVENEALAKPLLGLLEEVPTLRTVVLMRGAVSSDPRLVTWDAFMAAGEDVAPSVVEEATAAVRSDDVTLLIYTSGTTGRPKAVMLTHDNLSCAWDALAASTGGVTESDRVLSYLPLAHIAEMLISVVGSASAGYSVVFCHEPLALAEYLPRARPTHFFGVPRVWTRFQSVISDSLSELTGAKASLTAWARDVGAREVALRRSGGRASGALAVQHLLADRLVLSKVRAALGLDHARVVASGAAPTPVATIEFFASFGMELCEAYGQTEGTGGTTAARPGDSRPGTVGQALDGVTVRIAGDGEVLVRGGGVFTGYFKDPDATAATLRDGWLHTGDLGSLDGDGYLTITGRAKEIIITSGGKNIAPVAIEAALVELPLVSQAVVVGEQQRYLTALLTLDPAAAARFAAVNGRAENGDLHADAAVRAEIERGIREVVNPRFARVEQVRDIEILPAELSIDAGDLTPTMKLRRSVVTARHAELIDTMYTRDTQSLVLPGVTS